MASTETTAWWFRTALGDLAAARSVLADDRVPPREAAYLAQQAAEKALKAAIALDGIEPPRSHDLLFLRLRTPADLRAAAMSVDLVRLSLARTAARYPDLDEPAYERSDAERLVTDAAAIVAIVERFLVDAGIDASGLTPI
jgi:HEPN domain-containing protein